MSFYLSAVLLGLAYGTLGVGIFFLLRVFNIPDITTDGSFTLGGAVTAIFIVKGINSWLVLPVAFSAGAIAGMCTGIIHTKLRVNALLSGNLVMAASY